MGRTKSSDLTGQMVLPLLDITRRIFKGEDGELYRLEEVQPGLYMLKPLEKDYAIQFYGSNQVS